MGKIKRRHTKIFEAAATNQSAVLRTFLCEDQTVINLCDDRSWSPLHIAAYSGSYDSAIMLLTWGSYVHEVEKTQGNTPLHFSCTQGHISIAKALIEAGSDPCMINKQGNNCFHSAIIFATQNPIKGRTLLEIILENKKYTPETWHNLLHTQNAFQLTPAAFAIDSRIDNQLVSYISSLEDPKEEHVINILLHGWNDNIADWKIIEQNFNEDLKQPTYLFVYNSLVNRVSIPSLSAELRALINEQRGHYLEQKNKVAFTPITLDVIKVNLICYSTGGLIIRTFLNTWYQSEFIGIIEKIVMLAPANFGSPFAKFGKSSVGRMYVGQKKMGSLFECGEELLTSLEPGSQFQWELAHEDSLCTIGQQHFLPNKIRCTIIQGTQHYEKNIQSKVTRGDMKGTDGTVTISGASMKTIKYSINLAGGTAKETASLLHSTSEVAIRLHPAHTHRSITTSLVEKKDIFYNVKRALESNKEQFMESQLSFKKQNATVYSKLHTPGNLLVFKYEGNLKPVIIPIVIYHKENVIPTVGQALDRSVMQIENRGNIVGSIREQFSYTEYYSRSRNMFYKLVDLQIISNIMVSMASDLPGCAVSLAISLKGHTDQARIIGSTSWLPMMLDCFQSSELTTTHLFSLSPLSSDNEIIDLSSFSRTPSALLQQLETDECIDDSLREIGTEGISHLCRSLQEGNRLEDFLKLVCRTRGEELSGETRASVIRSLLPFFSSYPTAQEGCAYLIISTSWQQLTLLKRALDSFEAISFDAQLFSNCDSLYRLIYIEFESVPVKLLQGETELDIQKYITAGDNGKQVDLSKMVSEHVYYTSKRMSSVKRGRKIFSTLGGIHTRSHPLFTDGTLIPGAIEFINRLGENLQASAVILQGKREVPFAGSFSIPMLSLIYKDESNILQCILNYQNIFPEYEYCFIFPDTPTYRTVAKSISSALSLFRMNEKSLQKNSRDSFSTFLGAGCLAFDQNFLEAVDLVYLVRKSLEEIQVLLCRKCAYDAPKQWKDLADEISSAKMIISSDASNSVRVKALDELYAKCKQNEAAVWLSIEGADMILKLRELVHSGGDEGEDSSSVVDVNLLVDLFKTNPAIRNLLVGNVKSQEKKRVLPTVPARVRAPARPRSNQVRERNRRDNSRGRVMPSRNPVLLRSASCSKRGPSPVAPPRAPPPRAKTLSKNIRMEQKQPSTTGAKL